MPTKGMEPTNLLATHSAWRFRTYRKAVALLLLSKLKEGRADSYNPDNVRFLTDNQFGYATGVTGILRREKVAAAIAIGVFWAESLIFAQTGYEIGAIQIAGTANTPQIPFFVAACDYCLIGVIPGRSGLRRSCRGLGTPMTASTSGDFKMSVVVGRDEDT